MNKFLTILVHLVFFSMGNIMAQTDTIYMNNQKVSCSVKEVSPDAIKFVYPGEDILNSVYKNSVQKIVFKSGRVQTFIEATSFKRIDSVMDYEKVTITGLENEVKGLFKIAEVGAKAKGTTIYSNQEKVKERAYRKLKIQAAMYGANVIYLLQQREDGNKYGGRFGVSTSAETSLTGVAYSSQVPDMDDFKKRIANKTEFRVSQLFKLSASDWDIKRKEMNSLFMISSIVNENGITFIDGSFQDEDDSKPNPIRVQLATLSDKYFSVAYKKGATVYNLQLTFQ